MGTQLRSAAVPVMYARSASAPPPIDKARAAAARGSFARVAEPSNSTAVVAGSFRTVHARRPDARNRQTDAPSVTQPESVRRRISAAPNRRRILLLNDRFQPFDLSVVATLMLT